RAARVRVSAQLLQYFDVVVQQVPSLQAHLLIEGGKEHASRRRILVTNGGGQHQPMCFLGGQHQRFRPGAGVSPTSALFEDFEDVGHVLEPHQQVVND